MKNELYYYKAKLLSIYDGDTITVLIDLGLETFTKEKIRFARINTPELRSRNLEEKKLGKEAKELLKSILTDECYVKTTKRGKYGRWIGEVYVEKDGKLINVNDFLRKKGYDKNSKLYKGEQ